MDISTQISQLKKNGWTTAAIADALGASWQTARRWESGTDLPLMPECVSLALGMLAGMETPPRRRSKAKKEALPVPGNSLL